MKNILLRILPTKHTQLQVDKYKSSQMLEMFPDYIKKSNIIPGSCS